MNSKQLTIHKIDIPPGNSEVVKIQVGRIPSGAPVSIHAHVFRSLIDGPTVLVLGGVHGDEVNGVEIVRQSIQSGMFTRLITGTVVAIPILNVYGFINFSRDVPDGKDVNRSFPGSFRGSLASRVARVLSKKVLPEIDFGVDFHTGGRSIYNYPQIRYTVDNPDAEKLARAFGPPHILAKKPISKSLRKYAHEKKKPVLVFEGGENLRLDPYSIEVGMKGLRRLLVSQGMLTGTVEEIKSTHYRKSSWLRAPRAGMFRATKQAGQLVRKGEIIGSIIAPYGGQMYALKAHYSGHIIGHSNLPVINQGDGLFHIAYTPEE